MCVEFPGILAPKGMDSIAQRVALGTQAPAIDQGPTGRHPLVPVEMFTSSGRTGPSRCHLSSRAAEAISGTWAIRPATPIPAGSTGGWWSLCNNDRAFPLNRSTISHRVMTWLLE